MDALADEVAPQMRLVVLVAAFVGLRRGEMFILRRADVDLVHRTVAVRLQRQESKAVATSSLRRRPMPVGGTS